MGSTTYGSCRCWGDSGKESSSTKMLRSAAQTEQQPRSDNNKWEKVPFQLQRAISARIYGAIKIIFSAMTSLREFGVWGLGHVKTTCILVNEYSVSNGCQIRMEITSSGYLVKSYGFPICVWLRCFPESLSFLVHAGPVIYKYMLG